MASVGVVRIISGRRRFVRGSLRVAALSPLIPFPWLDAAARAPSLAAVQRRTLRAAADVLIPAQGRMPAASAVGAARYVELIAGTDPQLAALLQAGLRAIDAQAETTRGFRFDRATADQKAETLARVEKDDTPAGFFVALRDLV